MVNIDQEAATTSQEPLGTLATYRRRNVRVCYLSLWEEQVHTAISPAGDDPLWCPPRADTGGRPRRAESDAGRPSRSDQQVAGEFIVSLHLCTCLNGRNA